MARRKAPREEAPTRGRVKRAGLHLINSALDFALDRIWEFVALTLGGAIVTALGLLVLYFRSGRASWLWPWFTHALSFWAGVLLFMAVLVALAMRKALLRKREEAALQAAKNLRFASDELGFIDFFANKERAEHQLASVLIPIKKEIGAIGAASKKLTKQLRPDTPFVKRQQLASVAASTFNRHSEQMERQWKTFVEIDDVLAQSNMGCVNWLNTADEGQRAYLANQRRTALELLTSIEGAVPSLQSLCDTAASQKGISKDLNTALARMHFVLDGFIGALTKSGNRWRNLVALIDHKTAQNTTG